MRLSCATFYITGCDLELISNDSFDQTGDKDSRNEGIIQEEETDLLTPKWGVLPHYGGVFGLKC